MAEYYLLYVIFAAVAFVGSFAKEEQAQKTARIQNFICFVCVAVLLMFRHQSMGIDLQWRGSSPDAGYLPAFDFISKQSFRDVVRNCRSNKIYFEKGFVYYIKIVSLICNNRQFFLGITALISLLPIWWLFDRNSKKPVLSWIIYLALSPFLLLYSALRQGIVIGLAACMYILAEEKKWFWFTVLGAVCYSIHDASVLLFLIYPLVNIKINTRTRAIFILSLAGIILFKNQIIDLVLRFFPHYAYMFRNENGNAYRFFAVLLLIYIICCFSTDNSRFQNSYMNLFFLSIVFQLFGMFSDVAPRGGFFFMNALCVLFPDVLEKIRVRENAIILKYSSTLCFVVWGLYCIYSTYWAMAYPYYWFWERIG